MWRSVRQALRRLGYVAIRLLALFLLGLVPVVGVVAFPLGVLLGAWLLALEFSDNPLGNWGWDFERQRALLRFAGATLWEGSPISMLRRATHRVVS